MKFFAAVMAVIVLALSAMPCTDAKAFHKQSAKTELTKESKQQVPFTDDCSPFCQCNCCASAFVNHHITVLPVITQIFLQQKSYFTITKPVQVFLPVWQPPQLV
jgi:hypothetical protein